ncbi:MAG: hypothetical protein IKU29_03010 [Parabacteroides sp.]|nr:hypothetical protein [Parabacteroides sp.]
MNSKEDFDVRVYDYLKDKFPGHKLSDYEEACTYLTYQMIVETNKQITYYMRSNKPRRTPM